MVTPSPQDKVELRLGYVDMVLKRTIEDVSKDGTLEQKLALRVLFIHAINTLDQANPGLAEANEQGD